VKLRQILLVALLACGMSVGVFAEVATAAGNGNGNGGTPPGCTKNGHPDGPPCGPPCGKKNGNPYPGRKCQLALSNSNPNPGETLNVFGEGFASNSTQDLSIQSAPKHLVNAQSDANGDFSQNVTIPCDMTAGDHTIFATGVDPDGNATTLSAGVNVTNTACVLGTQTTATTTASNGNGSEQARGTTSSSSLPFTGGAATVLLTTLALGMILAGTVAVRVARRRSHQSAA